MDNKEKFLKFIKALCDKYDEYHGEYPESKLEGEAVFDFIKTICDIEFEENDTPDQLYSH